MDIGIDLGTTFSVLAVDGKVELASDYPGGAGIYLEDCDVTVIPSPCGESTFPSVMIQDPDNPESWLFGTEAMQKAEEGLAPVMFSKRKIGTLEEIPVANGTVLAKDVAALFLAHLKQCAEQALGVPVTRAVVTHPAYFDRGAVEETREAARRAGFDMSLPQQMLMEPTAAALAYTRTDQRDPLRILTYDLGGGTFDVTYMERIDGVIQIRAFDGNHLLGGYNFDKELVRLVRSRLEAKGRKIVLDEGDPVDRGRLARLLHIAENVKIALSKAATDTTEVEFGVRNVLVDEQARPIQVNERITRQQFVAAIQPWLDETVACCRRALVKGKATADDLHQVLLVGGSSYGPWVAQSLKAAFPSAQMRLFNPDLCVGAGAAIHAKKALPSVTNIGDFSLQNDTPAHSVLDRLHISGRFLRSSDGAPPRSPMTVSLEMAIGSPPSPVPLNADGGFLFQNVELPVEGDNKFRLCLRDAGGHMVAEHPLVIHHAPPSAPGAAAGIASSGISGSTSVLPRPLYVETARGMVALAEEGVALPARCVAQFERANSNPNITLRLFQEQDPVGAVRIENIPDDAGAGAPVELTIEVTADNQVRGTVVIYRSARGGSSNPTRGSVALACPIDVRFDPTAIPTVEELRRQCDELRSRLDVLPLTDSYLHSRVGPECAVLLDRIVEGFDRQPVERQEIYVDLRKLRHLLIPPKDDMVPPLRDFQQLVESCRSDIEELKTTNNALLAELEKSGADQLTVDGRTVTQRRTSATLARLTELRQKVDELDRTSLAAHASKDRVAWPKAFERLVGTSADIDRLKPPAPDISKLPTPLLKIIVVHRELARRDELLSKHARLLAQQGEVGDWAGELTDLHARLEEAASAVARIDDEAPSEQAIAQIQEVLKSVRGLDARIAAIGKPIH